jgi:PAS domain S-box-containing protein
VKLFWKIHLAVFLSLVVAVTLPVACGIVPPVTAFSSLALAVLGVGLSLTIGHFTRPTPTARDKLNRERAERQRIEEELRSSQERFKTLFDYAPDAYYLHDLQGRLIDVNQAAERLTGYGRDELIGHVLLDLDFLPASERPKILSLVAQNTAGVTTGPDEITLRRRDGSQIVVEVTTRTLRIKGEPIVLGIGRDITERRKAEA